MSITAADVSAAFSLLEGNAYRNPEGVSVADWVDAFAFRAASATFFCSTDFAIPSSMRQARSYARSRSCCESGKSCCG